MAIICNSTISVVDAAKKILRISAEIQNDTEPVHTVTIENVDASSGLDASKKAEIANTVWGKYLKKRNDQIVLDNLNAQITSADLVNALNTNIEGRTI